MARSLHGIHRPNIELSAPAHQLLVALASGWEGRLNELASVRCQGKGDVQLSVDVDADNMIELICIPVSWQGC